MTLIDNAAGLGLRRGLLPQLLAMAPGAVDFLECAPGAIASSCGSRPRLRPRPAALSIRVMG